MDINKVIEVLEKLLIKYKEKEDYWRSEAFKKVRNAYDVTTRLLEREINK